MIATTSPKNAPVPPKQESLSRRKAQSGLGAFERGLVMHFAHDRNLPFKPGYQND
jgi:hypothetical protein